MLLAVVAVGDAGLRVNVEAFEVVLQNEVHDAGDGVGAVDGRRAARDDLDALDHRFREQVDVDSAEPIRRHHPAAVEQHERALRAQAAQVHVRRRPRIADLLAAVSGASFMKNGGR